MAITGIDTIDGKQIIAAGAVSAKSAEMAYNDENGNPITGYQVAGDYYSASNPSGFITGVDLTPYQTTAGMTAYQPVGDYYSASNPSGFITGLPEEEEVEFEEIDLTNYQSAGDYYSASNPSGFITEVPVGTMNESAFGYDSDNKISSYNGSAIGGSAPTYGYTDTDLISSIDTSGLYATSALEAKSANALINGGRLGYDVYAVTGAGTNSMTLMILNPQTTPFGNTSGIYSPLYYAQGACMTYGSSAGNTQYFGGFFKGNEWYISNATAGQALRGETHASRGVHLSGATTAGYGFNLAIGAVSGVNSTGSWKYGHDEDAALRAVSSCDMHESAFGYDANDKISGYNGSAFAGGGGEFPQSATEAIETVTANSADWNGTTETVSSNSGAWGGSALPISAGPGIKVSLQNDTLVFENDETLLYSTRSPANTINLSEVSTGFEKLRLELSSYQSREIVNYTEVKPNASYLTYFANALIPAATYPLQVAGIQFTSNNAMTYTMTTGVRMCYKVNETYGDQYTAIATTNIRDVGFITKIWGVNRI